MVIRGLLLQLHGGMPYIGSRAVEVMRLLMDLLGDVVVGRHVWVGVQWCWMV